MKHKIMKRIGIFLKAVGIFLLVSASFVPLSFAVNPPTMNDYTALPPFVDQSVKPNILIMLDNSGSMNEYIYEGQAYDPNHNYYGYFTSEYMYSYGQRFEIDNANGQWSGNFLNFMTMRRIDVMRKVVTGGKPTSAMGHGAMRLWQEEKTGYDYYHLYRHNGGDISPFDGDYWYYMEDDGKIHVYTYTNRWNLQGSYDVIIQKDPVLEPGDFYDYDGDGQMRLSGVLQRFGHDAFWGNIWFVEDSKNNTRQGGAVSNPIGPHAQFSSLINDLRNKPCDKWTPLAETYYVAMQHFRSQAVEISGYASQASQPNHDPFDHSEWCAKNFVLVLTDGASTRDAVIPSYLKDYADSRSPSFFLEDESGAAYTNTSGRYPDGGTDFLKDITYYARANNLRDDVDGHTHIIPYIVFAFEEDENARDLLMEAARQGGWRRQINDNIPGLRSDGTLVDGYEREDLVPDNYFEAQDGHALEDALRNAILGMLDRAASGTAAAVVTPDGRSEGEGSVVQSYFLPRRAEGEREISWSGYMHSLWIDQCGNLREDTGGNRQLDLSSNKIIKYEYFDDQGTLAQRFSPVLENGELVCPGYDPNSGSEPFNINELESIFEAGRVLWDQTPESRRIYTSVGGGMIDFVYNNDIAAYLGVNDASVDNAYSLSHLGETTAERAQTLVDYTRGIDKDGALRNRTIAIDGGAEKVWKLGNIVSSTPVVVGGAVERYDLIYAQEDYRRYRQDQRNRETMVYVGANDGMLHAFTHGRYDRGDLKFNEVGGDPLGTEVWAYIPRVLLPHLKWLADPAYTHVFYADLQPKVFDAKIRNGSNWGTFILLGLNKGGKRIYINKDGEEEILYPTYSLIDVTEPRSPKLVWEKSYEGTGLTTSIPTVFKVGNDWFAAFGSGPNDATGKTDYKGISDQTGTMYIIDLATGNLRRSIQTGTNNAFLNSPVAYDRLLNYNVDGVYFGETYLDKGTWKGKIHKIGISSELEEPTYASTPGSWSHSVIFESPGPVTAGIHMRADPDNNAMLFFGTGRYLSQEDKQDVAQQYLFGIKDPLYDVNNTGTAVNFNELFEANPIEVTEEGNVYKNGTLYTVDAEGGNTGTGTFDEMSVYVGNNYQGWYRKLETFGAFPSERIVSRPSLIGGTLLVPTFVPVDDVCEPLGYSNVLALSYRTGTGFKRHVLSEDESPRRIDGQAVTAIKFKKDTVGAPAASIAHHGTDIAIIQHDTAATFIFEIDPDLQRSRITGWRDR